MPQEFARLAERIVDAILEVDPFRAAEAGDHRYDGRLPDLSPDGIAGRTAMLRDAARALSEVDVAGLGAEDQVDHAVLLGLVERDLFELTDVRKHEWNPLAHNPGPLLHALLARAHAPVEERLSSLRERLATLPDTLAVARSVLRDCPRIHLETAVGQFAGVAALVRTEVPALVAQAPALAGPVNPAAEAAAQALDGFGEWLRARLAEGGGRDPRLGRRLWEARLWHTLDTELSAAEVLARAEATVAETNEQLREAAAELLGEPASGATARAALDRLADDRPDDKSIVDAAHRALAETTAFVRDHDLVSLVDDPCVVQEMPEFARGVAVAYCDSPGMLETADMPTFYCISPTPADWPPERVTSFYREYNHAMVRDLTVHEAMPGHYLQLAHSRRFRGSTRARALGFSDPFVEGWAVYAEEMMAGAGYGGLPVRIQQLKMRLRMSINALLDQLVHAEGIGEAEAMALMTGRGFQEEGEAAGKWRRAQLTSTQLSTYFVGYLEIAEVARARPAGTPVRGWHDEMLAHGSPAPRHLRTLLTGASS